MRNVIRAQAPSNLALIKYMGKTDAALNLPANPSLSLTLDRLRTTTEIAELQAPPSARSRLVWSGEAPEGAPGRAPSLDPAGIARLEKHFERVREAMPALARQFGFGLREAPSAIEVKSANTFPASSGIASSASSFAAFTLATAALLAKDSTSFAAALDGDAALRNRLASLSRQGSGSSCRSFHGPFVLWEGESVRPVASKLPELSHFVLVVSSSPKAVSSSEAHRRVTGSPLWSGRPGRAEGRLRALRQALDQGDFAACARLSWEEAWEMHSLFHTSEPPFSYWEPGTMQVLRWLEPLVNGSDAPIVTLDAGPNVHLIVPEASKAAWQARLGLAFPSLEIIEDAPGRGASLV